jgi:mycothiol synthase
MGLRLDVAASDADLEAWRRVRRAVLPDERAVSVEEIRSTATEDTLHLLAVLDGDVVGSGLSNRSSGCGRSATNVRQRCPMGSPS